MTTLDYSQRTTDYCATLEDQVESVRSIMRSRHRSNDASEVVSLCQKATIMISHVKALQAIINDLATGDADSDWSIDPSALTDADEGDEAGNVNTPENNGHPMDRFPADIQPGFAGDLFDLGVDMMRAKPLFQSLEDILAPRPAKANRSKGV